ncbi:alpha-hydroxy-acid oxidizing enzyme [Limnohabitans sp. T6-5]|uniref:alpha-hydroxy acid oxidase n=1 Tax=Limnohabitans sp. T6-5 TaxID=1100724 RepID=UPI000D365283|nr:alpha-hydroxy acid oxidase [Limnohabitans sp. T6-5]PUE07155.1 alpha-hydroxy-acid oxidizing enzyme [Limnohabitans sp. T6-5]
MPTPIVNLQDHEHAAQAALSASAWAYFSGGAADEITLRSNLRGWQQWGLAPRVLQDLSGGHTRCTLLGKTWPFPLLVAPMAFQRWAHADGEAGMAMAAAAQQCGLVLSHQTSTPLHTVAPLMLAEPDRGPLWFQLYWPSDKVYLQDLIQQVEAAGYEALVLTVDAPVHGVRDRERRKGIQLPLGVRAVHWPPEAAPSTDTSGLCAGLANAAPTWADVAWLQSMTRLPILLKGITHPQDALQAARLQVAGVIVSNHGGRTLDTLPDTAHLLAPIAVAVRCQNTATNHTMNILVDGGIRRGTDIFKALALGADAVLLGRPAVFGLAHAGAQGVAHVLRLLRDEFEMTLALCGCAQVQDIHLNHVAALEQHVNVHLQGAKGLA